MAEGGAGVSGIRVTWSDPEVSPVVFVIVKDGAVGLASPDYIANLVTDIHSGALFTSDAWDHLMILTPDTEFPVGCHVAITTENGAMVARFQSGGRSGIVRYRMEI